MSKSAARFGRAVWGMLPGRRLLVTHREQTSSQSWARRGIVSCKKGRKGQEAAGDSSSACNPFSCRVPSCCCCDKSLRRGLSEQHGLNNSERGSQESRSKSKRQARGSGEREGILRGGKGRMSFRRKVTASETEFSKPQKLEGLVDWAH
eukprot:1799315-Rhodomonas_salina.1